MIPNRQTTINTSPVQSLQVGTDSNGNINYWNEPEGRWVPVTDQGSIDSIVRALPNEYRVPVAQASTSAALQPPQTSTAMPNLNRGVSGWEVTNMERNRAESQASGLELINRDRAGQSTGAPGYKLGAYLISNNLTYGLAAPQLGMGISEVQHAVKYGIVKSESYKATLERCGLYGFVVDRSLAQ